MSLTQKNRMTAIGTPLGEDVLCLASFNGREELGRLFEYEVELLSENHNVSFKEIVGHNVTVRLNTTRSDEPRYFNGYVSRFTQHPSTERYASYRATIVPWFWFLTRASDCRIWSGADKTRTAPEIIKEVFQSRNFKDFEDKLSGNYTAWDFCVQYRETDFNFISRLMEQEGIYYYFKHEDGKHTLVLADSTDDHQPFPKYEEIKFRPPSGGTSDLEYVRDWMRSKELFTGKYVHTDFDFENPGKDLCTEPKIIPRGHAQADFEIFDYPGEFTKPDDGKNWAKIRIEELQARHELLHGSADARGMAAGFTFDLKDLQREDQNRKYLIVSVAHSMRVDGYESGGSSGGGDSYNCSFTVLPATEAFRPARTTPKPLIQGPQTAIVVGPKGEEIHTDKYGRVKLKFHWDRYSKADEKSSCWVRVSQAWAGKKWGAIYLPRIGQEVVVEFLEGYPDLPIITGRVYNGEAMPPYDLPGEMTKSTLKSNSSKGGQGFNEIRFEDKKGEEQIFVHGEKDEDIRIKNDAREWIGNERHLIIKKDQLEQVEGDKHSIVKGDRISKIEGDHGETTKGDHLASIDGSDHLTVKGDQNTKIDGDDSLKVGGNWNNEAGQKISVKAGMDLHEKAGMNYAMEAGMAVHIKAGMTVVIEGGVQLSLKVGGNFIDINPAGVFIKGTMVMINTGGAAGSGSGSSPTAPVAPEAPDPPKEAKAATDAKPGEADKPPKPPKPPKPAKYGGSATVLKNASQSGTPFCEKCEAAKAAAAQA